MATSTEIENILRKNKKIFRQVGLKEMENNLEKITCS